MWCTASSISCRLLLEVVIFAALQTAACTRPGGGTVALGVGQGLIRLMPSRLALRGGMPSKQAEEAWRETMAMRAKYDQAEQNMDEDLRTATDKIIEEIDRRSAARDKELRDDIELNGPRWVPPINRHFMDPTNWTSEFGPEFHPPYPCVPTLAMMDPSTRLRESACRGRTYEVRDIIANEEGQVNKTDDGGLYAAIHWASLMGHADTVEALIELGANTNERTRHRRNPLHYACEEGRTDVVKVLLEAGTSPYAKDVDNAIPIDLARKFGHLAAFELMKEFMEKNPNAGPEEEDRTIPFIPEEEFGEPHFEEEDMFEVVEEDEDDRLANLAKMGGGKDFGATWGRQRHG